MTKPTEYNKSDSTDRKEPTTMKPYRILNALLYLAASLVAVATTPTAHAREATAYERFCLETMGHIESTLASQLPGDCKIVATHPSPLGRRFAGATQIRDAWISRNDKVVAKVVLFAWPLPDDPLLAGSTVSQVRLEIDRDGKKVVLGIAVIGEDTQLVGEVVNMVDRSTEAVPLPKLDGRSAKGLQLECRLVQATFVVGEPVNVWCTVKNTTDSIKPVGWHPFGGGHFCQVPGDKAASGGLLPTAVPHLDRPIKITSKDGPGYALFVPAHESVRILLTHKEDRPGKFKGRVVYDPVSPRDGAWEMTKNGPPWKDELLSSNEFEYEVVAAAKARAAPVATTVAELRDNLIGRTVAVTVNSKSRGGGPTPPPGTVTDVGEGLRFVGILESFAGDTIVLRFPPPATFGRHNIHKPGVTRIEILPQENRQPAPKTTEKGSSK